MNRYNLEKMGRPLMKLIECLLGTKSGNLKIKKKKKRIITLPAKFLLNLTAIGLQNVLLLMWLLVSVWVLILF